MMQAGNVTTPVGVGPYGGSFGVPQFMDNLISDPPKWVSKVVVWSSANAPNAHINGLSFNCMLASGTTKDVNYGPQKGVQNTV